MIHPDRTTWFMVADGTKARLFESSRRGDRWKLIKEWRDDAARAPSRELGDDRPTRGWKSGSGTRYSVDVPSEHDKAEEAFIQKRASFLNSAATDGAYDQLVLTAPPAALGIFRKRLSPEATAKYIAVLDKDLTNMPDHELYEYFNNNIERW